MERKDPAKQLYVTTIDVARELENRSNRERGLKVFVTLKVTGHFINIVKYIPLKGSSYLPLPEELRNSKKGLINIKNNDNRCFVWCHVRHLNPLKHHSERITERDRECIERLDYSGITFPVTVEQISKIERQNNININVFGYNDATIQSIYPIRISREKYDDHIELLFIEDENKGEGRLKQHYVYIKDFNRLMFSFTKKIIKNIFACIVCNAFILVVT